MGAGYALEPVRAATTIEQIMAHAKQHDYTLQGIIQATVASEFFKRNEFVVPGYLVHWSCFAKIIRFPPAAERRQRKAPGFSPGATDNKYTSRGAATA